jgi:hypothetical protein
MAEQKEKEKKACEYPDCDRETWKNDEHCIFHSEDIEGKKDEFDEQFWEEFEIQKKHEKKYDFREFVFPGDILFEKIEFEKEAYFRNAQFSGKAYFDEVQFSENAIFDEAQFSGVASFECSHFFGKAYFRGAQFSGEAKFWGAQFSGEVKFEEAQFSGEAIFNWSQFSGRANFYRSTFAGDKLYGLFTSLRTSGIERILRGRYKIRDFRFHLGEKIAKEYPMIDRMTKDAWYLDDFKNNHPFVYAIWNVTANCGRSIWRWISWSLFFAFYFAFNFYLIYYVNPWAFNFDSSIEATNFGSFLYYSIVTFTTLGFGDIIPTANYVQRWVIAEVIIGYIMLGGLISILANKLARRS